MKYDFFELTEAEFEIMQVLWRIKRPLCAEDIAKRLTGRSRATVAALLRRMAAKSAVQYISIDRKAMYFFSVLEPVYKAMLLKNLAESLFGGDRAELVRLLLCDMDVTAGELEGVKAAAERAREVAERMARAEAAEKEAENVRAESAEAADADGEEPDGKEAAGKRAAGTVTERYCREYRRLGERLTHVRPYPFGFKKPYAPSAARHAAANAGYG